MRKTRPSVFSITLRAARQIVCLLLTLAAGASAQTATDLNEGFRLVHDDTTGVFTLSWWGKAGRTYFVQTSTDLMAWTYLPMVESGADDVSGIQFTNTEVRQFWRLRYTNQTYTGTAGEADFDGDTVSNLDEAQNNTDPFSTSDSDADSMPRDWEIAMGLDPDDPYDMLMDLDGDRVPNLYEFKHGTNAADIDSFRQPHFIVNATTGTDSTGSAIKKTIQWTIQNSNLADYTIIRVQPGTHAEFYNQTKRFLLLGDTGGKVIINQTGNSAIKLGKGETVVRDVSIIPDTWAVLRGPVTIELAGVNDQAALVNCTISGQGMYSRAPVSVARGTLTLSHCTITNNFSGSAFDFDNPLFVTGTAGAVSLFDDGETRYTSMTTPPAGFTAANQRLIVRDSILWNPATVAGGEIFARSGSVVVVHASIIRGGQHGGLDTLPLIDRYGYSMTGSPSVRGGTSSAFPRKDIQGEVSVGMADYGADEHVDADADGLPDWWEISHFGSVTSATAAGDDETPPDGLTNLEEYLLGYQPLNRTTLGVSGETDLLSALRRPWDGYYPVSLSADADGDGLSAGWELYLGTSDSLHDTNGDGIADGVAWLAGMNPLTDDLDGDGVSAASEAAMGTNPLSADSDGDGVNDALDAYPLDPFLTALTPGSGDMTAPLVALEKPAEGVLVP